MNTVFLSKRNGLRTRTSEELNLGGPQKRATLGHTTLHAPLARGLGAALKKEHHLALHRSPPENPSSPPLHPGPHHTFLMAQLHAADALVFLALALQAGPRSVTCPTTYVWGSPPALDRDFPKDTTHPLPLPTGERVLDDDLMFRHSIDSLFAGPAYV